MKKILAVVVALVMCFSSVAALANYSEFENNGYGNNYGYNGRYTEVSYYVEEQFGYGDHYIVGLDPTGYTTRDQAIAMLYSCLYNSDIDYYSWYRGNLNQFSDYYTARNYLYDESMWQLSVAQGVINGIPEGYVVNLKPTASLTRAMAAKIFVEFIDANNIYVDLTRGSRNFNDVYYNDWFYNYVYQCARTGLVQGDGYNFYPQDLIKREDFLLMVYRLFVENYGMDEEDFISAIKETGLFVFDDEYGNSNNGYYIDIENGDMTLYLEVGDYYTLDFDTNISGLRRNDQISWTSSNKRIVEVDEDGNLYANQEGTVTITGSYKSYKGTIKVVAEAGSSNGSVDKNDEYVADPDNYDKADRNLVQRLQKTTVINFAENNLGEKQYVTVSGINKDCWVDVQSASGLYKLEGEYNDDHTVFYGYVTGIRDGAYEVIIVSVYLNGYDEPIKEASFTFDETNYNTAN